VVLSTVTRWSEHIGGHVCTKLADNRRQFVVSDYVSFARFVVEAVALWFED